MQKRARFKIKQIEKSGPRKLLIKNERNLKNKIIPVNTDNFSIDWILNSLIKIFTNFIGLAK